MDILIPSKKFAIEYNGDYWHSDDMGRGYDYHQKKFDEAKVGGFTLLHIWESRWKSEYKDTYLKVINHFLFNQEIENLDDILKDNIFLD